MLDSILLPFIMAASGSKSTTRKRGGHKRIMTAAKREEASETETAPATVSAASEPTDSDPKQLAVKAEPNPSGGPIRVKSITGMTPENFREVAKQEERRRRPKPKTATPLVAWMCSST